MYLCEQANVKENFLQKTSFNRLKLDLLMIENGAIFVAAGLMASVLKGRNAAELTLPCM